MFLIEFYDLNMFFPVLIESAGADLEIGQNKNGNHQGRKRKRQKSGDLGPTKVRPLSQALP